MYGTDNAERFSGKFRRMHILRFLQPRMPIPESRKHSETDLTDPSGSPDSPDTPSFLFVCFAGGAERNRKRYHSQNHPDPPADLPPETDKRSLQTVLLFPGTASASPDPVFL